MKTIVIYSNCGGSAIKRMLNDHITTKNEFNVNHIPNYENLHKNNLDNNHLELLLKCDIFIYQPFNKNFDYSEYDVKKILSLLSNNCLIIKINYYRFYGFWYNSSYKPYNQYGKYSFGNFDTYGIHNSFKDYNSKNMKDIKLKINNIDISKDEIINHFNKKLQEFKYIDDNSDINMYNFFLENYKTKHLFHDPYHPTCIFFYEIFRELVFKLLNIKLPIEDEIFIYSNPKFDGTNHALPILPIIKKHLGMNLPERIPVFYPQRKLYLSIYEYYFIRLSSQNLENFLMRIKHNKRLHRIYTTPVKNKKNYFTYLNFT